MSGGPSRGVTATLVVAMAEALAVALCSLGLSKQGAMGAGDGGRTSHALPVLGPREGGPGPTYRTETPLPPHARWQQEQDPQSKG